MQLLIRFVIEIELRSVDLTDYPGQETFNASFGRRLQDSEPSYPSRAANGPEEADSEAAIPPTQRISQVRLTEHEPVMDQELTVLGPWVRSLRLRIDRCLCTCPGQHYGPFKVCTRLAKACVSVMAQHVARVDFRTAHEIQVSPHDVMIQLVAQPAPSPVTLIPSPRIRGMRA